MDLERAATAADAGPEAEAPARITPMMEQYIEIKAANPDCLLFYRMGDFYELFFGDAETASRALGIVLTKRGKHLGRDIPMCGVPVERAEDYLHRLIALGHRVAVCEQIEDPAEARKRGAKSLVRRDVIRLVTPGTLTEDTLLEARRNNWLVAVARGRPASDAEALFGIAWLDISTGEFFAAECDRTRLAAELARLEPGEVVIADNLYEDAELKPLWRSLGGGEPGHPRSVRRRHRRPPAGCFLQRGDGRFLRRVLAPRAFRRGRGRRLMWTAPRLGKRPALSPPAREAAAVLVIDAPTRANLELIRTLSGETRGSLLSVIDRTMTAAGARMLSARLASPLIEPDAINGRLDAVALLVEDARRRAELREALAKTPDLSRSLARLSLGRGGPRDLAAVRDALGSAENIADVLGDAAKLPPELASALKALAAPGGKLAGELAAALADDLPLIKRDGGFVRPGYDADLDAARKLRDDARHVIVGLQTRYAEETGIRSLKIKHNNVLGYFVEVPAAQGERLLAGPARETFIHRQTLAGAMRFTSAELGELESKIASAGERALGLELSIFDQLDGKSDRRRRRASKRSPMRWRAWMSPPRSPSLPRREAWTRPEVDASLDFKIEAGRHPVVEESLRREHGPFVANDSDLSPPAGAAAGRIWLVTGPEHGGQVHVSAPERADRDPGANGRLRAGAARQDRRGRPAVLARRRGRRSCPRPLHLHGRDGRDRGDPASGDRALAGDPRRDRPRHRDLRRPIDRLGVARASARKQPLPRAVRHPFP